MHAELKGDLLRVIGSGRLPSEQVREGIRAALATPDLPEGLKVLFDFRAMKGLDLTQGEVRALRSLVADAKLPQLGARLAWVATADVVFGLGCMFRAFASLLPLDVEVFRELDEAVEWLDAEPGAHAI